MAIRGMMIINEYILLIMTPSVYREGDRPADMSPHPVNNTACYQGVMLAFKFFTVSNAFWPVSFTCPARGITTPVIRATQIARRMIFTSISFNLHHHLINWSA